MLHTRFISLLTLLPLVLSPGFSLAEQQITKSQQVQAIEKLQFLVGNWAGKGVSYSENGEKSEYFDTEDIWFDVQN